MTRFKRTYSPIDHHKTVENQAWHPRPKNSRLTLRKWINTPLPATQQKQECVKQSGTPSHSEAAAPSQEGGDAPLHAGTTDEVQIQADGYSDVETGSIVITMESGEDQAWNSDKDGGNSSDSSSSTLGYKRGRHPELVDQALEQIKEEAALYMQQRVHSRKPSLQILSDARVQEWPKNDNICILNYHPKWNFKKLVAAIRAETVRIECDTVIIYLEMTQDFDDAPPSRMGFKACVRLFVSTATQLGFLSQTYYHRFTAAQ